MHRPDRLIAQPLHGHTVTPVLWRYWDIPFVGEIALLLLAAPLLYFPGRFPSWASYAGFGLLALGWLWRRWQTGVWFRRTPADWPIFFLFVVMLPVSIWAAPEPLRVEYSIPRAYILIWNFCLFWSVVSHAGRRRELFYLCVAGFMAAGLLIGVVALFGLKWATKIGVLAPIVHRIPGPLVGVFEGAETGISANQLAGALLYVLPIFLALTVVFLRDRAGRKALVAGLGTLFLYGLLVLTQSRAGYLGAALGTAVFALLLFDWGRKGLVAGGMTLLMASPFLPYSQVIGLVADAPPVEAVGGVSSFGFRQVVWESALYGLSDFAFTGMGLGTFRKIAFLLYPMVGISPTYDIAHAHNFFLQTGLDFGLPGLIAVLSLYLVGVAQMVQLMGKKTMPIWSVWAAGLVAALTGQSAYSLLDAVSMGSKPNFLFWWLFALIFATGNEVLTGNWSPSRDPNQSLNPPSSYLIRPSSLEDNE